MKGVVEPAAPKDVHFIIFAVDRIDQAVGAKKFLHFHARSIKDGSNLSMILGNILLTIYSNCPSSEVGKGLPLIRVVVKALSISVISHHLA
jgi:hypothetical protein